MVPVTQIRSPAWAVVRRTMRPVGTSPTAVTDRVSGSLRLHRIAAEERAGEIPGRLSEAGRESGKPALGPVVGQGEAQQEAGRIGALGGKVGDVHAERLAGDGAGRIVGQEMDALDQGVGGQDEIVPGRRRQAGRIVLEAQAPLAGDGREEAGDEAVFARASPTHRPVTCADRRYRFACPAAFFSSSPGRTSRATLSRTALTRPGSSSP